MAILNYADLARFMNREFNEGQQAAASTIIQALESELSVLLNRPLQPIRVTDEKHFLESAQKQIFLRKGPVREVIQFRIGQIPTNSTMFEQNLNDYTITPWGIDNILISGIGYIAYVTYNAGLLDADVQALERVVLFASAREMSKVLIDAQGLGRLDVEGTKYFFEANGAGGFTTAEMKSVERYKRRVIR
jgi:hypothetical protein